MPMHGFMIKLIEYIYNYYNQIILNYYNEMNKLH